MAELASDGGEAARAAGQASWLLDVELDTAWREAMIQKIRHVGQVCGGGDRADREVLHAAGHGCGYGNGAYATALSHGHIRLDEAP